MSVPVVCLNDGNEMPFFGLGTYGLKGKDGEAAVRYAIENGYRHIDTAAAYDNEAEIGRAICAKIEDGTVRREDLFVTTKLSPVSHQKNEVVNSCIGSLERLGLDYIDLFLIHTPISLKPLGESKKMVPSDIDYVETWRGMEKCKNSGYTSSIGVSNFNSQQISRLISSGNILPSNNQIEVTLNLNQNPLIEFCKKWDIAVTGYSPLGKPGKRPNIQNLWLHPVVQNLAKKYNKSPAQISLRFVYQSGAAPIPKSVTFSRIEENINIFDFNLTKEEMRELESIGTGARVVSLEEFKDAKYFPFGISR
ncbi:hypothetical protein QAD02_015914 [Eretmocerus hayati]|uniref:Uncharacterized protein n=1 Tax=Eretmocerus hayati TaxID=131215 RepID=A0ACC2PCE7_9HYME|nr:hypothetical protein QAD02_015914 [Eretmocerus hayati]